VRIFSSSSIIGSSSDFLNPHIFLLLALINGSTRKIHTRRTFRVDYSKATTTFRRILYFKLHIRGIGLHIVDFQSRIQRKRGCIGPHAVVDYNLTLCPLQLYHGQPYAIVDLIPCQSRLFPPIRDLGFAPSDRRNCIATLLTSGPSL
jgi:hypothetical protein